MNVGEYIKQLRIKKGITQEELGKIVGVQRAAVQKWECNKTQNLKRTTIQKLADYFDVNPSSFINSSVVSNDNSGITFDDFSYAMYNEAKELTEEQKEMLLDMAKTLKNRLKEKGKLK